jgi:hypothetical protein
VKTAVEVTHRQGLMLGARTFPGNLNRTGFRGGLLA